MIWKLLIKRKRGIVIARETSWRRRFCVCVCFNECSIACFCPNKNGGGERQRERDMTQEKTEIIKLVMLPPTIVQQQGHTFHFIPVKAGIF